MKNFQNNPTSAPGIRRVSNIDRLEDEGKNTALSQILQTREVRQAIIGIIPNVLNAYTGNSRFKRYSMKMLERFINKALSSPDDILEKKELPLLFEDNQFLKNVSEPLPGAINGLFDILITIAGTIETLPGDEKKEVMGNVLSTISTGQTGELINRFARIMTDIHQDDHEFLSRMLGPGLAQLLDTLDFGELKVFLDGTFKDLTSLLKVINDTMFDKPAKVVLLMTIIPMIVNMITEVLEDTIRRFNEFPPDLVADVIFSLFREVDAKTVGTLSNGAMELFRKIIVGSALIGEPGMPQDRMDMARFIDEVTDEIDIEILWKFRELLGQSKERMNLSLLTVLKNKPELIISSLKNSQKIRNYQIKAIRQKLGLIENLPETEVTEAFNKGVSDIDAGSIAEIINTGSVLINRLNSSDPDLLPDLIDKFVSTLDLYEIEDTVNFSMNNIGEVIKPLGDILFPNIIKMAADWLSTNENEYDQELVEARNTIIQFLNKNEEAA